MAGIGNLRTSRTACVLMGAAAILLLALPANADVFNARPVTPLGNSDLDIMFTRSPLDSPAGIYVSGPQFSAVLSQANNAVFTSTASGGSIASFVLELSAASTSNVFGIYDFADPSKKVELFSGANSAGDQTVVTFLLDGRVLVLFQDSGVVGFSGSFGFYIDVLDAPAGGGDGNPNTLDYTLYSEDSLNPGGAAQALGFQGNNATTLQILPFAAGLFTTGEWIIAFEDGLVGGPLGGSADNDYSDMVVLVESVVPVTIPVPTVSHWGLAILALVLLTLARLQFSRRPDAATANVHAR